MPKGRNPDLCPVKIMKAWLARREVGKSSDAVLFLASGKPAKPISKTTCRENLKIGLAESSLPLITAHGSVRQTVVCQTHSWAANHGILARQICISGARGQMRCGYHPALRGVAGTQNHAVICQAKQGSPPDSCRSGGLLTRISPRERTRAL